MPTRGRPFQPGNTFGRGRPRGSRNKLTSIAKDLLEQYAPSLMRKAIADALQGEDVATRRLLINCLLKAGAPANRKLKNLEFRTAADVLRASETVIREVTAGRLASEEAEKFVRILDFHRDAIETQDLAERIAKVEAKL
jgi:hypothetical protein